MNFSSLEGEKLISNIWSVGSAGTLQSEKYTWLQVKHGSINKSDHMFGYKSLESFLDLHQGWNFLK